MRKFLITIGGSQSLWGTTWTLADINNSNFGFEFSVKGRLISTQLVSIDNIQIAVFYSETIAGVTTPKVQIRSSAQFNSNAIIK